MRCTYLMFNRIRCMNHGYPADYCYLHGGDVKPRVSNDPLRADRDRLAAENDRLKARVEELVQFLEEGEDGDIT